MSFKTREERRAAYKRVFIDTNDGAAVLDDLVGRFHDGELFSTDALDMARRVGARQAIQWILANITDLPTTKESND